MVARLVVFVHLWLIDILPLFAVVVATGFVALCRRDKVAPKTVLRGFIADLCGIVSYVANPRADGYSNNGSDERRLAQEYYERVGYP